MAVAYIMSITNLSWKDALKVVRVGRAVANPNVGFQQQLEDFESTRVHEVSYACPSPESTRLVLADAISMGMPKTQFFHAEFCNDFGKKGACSCGRSCD